MGAVVTALDLEDSWKKAAEAFEPANIVTKEDLKSIKREMDRPLRLIAKYKLGKDIFWDLPQTTHSEGETLRDTAERAIKQRVGDKLNVQILGNAPLSFYKFKYPKHYQEKTDRKWATREELKELMDEDIYKALDNMLHDED